MDSFSNDSANDLISSEQLASFSIAQHFCEACGDMTPHHIEEIINKVQEKRIDEESSEDLLFIPPISSHECVLCREQEESHIDEEYL